MLEELLKDDFVPICWNFDLTQMQDSWSWRNTHLAREIVHFLIDEHGEINQRSLLKAIRILEENLYSLLPNRHHDDSRLTHFLGILRLLSTDQGIVYALRRISRPENHQGALQLIRDTLFLSDSQRVTDVEARKAVLSALLTSLRQNVGSCFATAPAIMIQQEQPLQFLTDIGQLFGTGRLTRVYEGVEYTVPLSIEWGVADLFRPVSLSSLGKNPIKTLSLSPGLQAAFGKNEPQAVEKLIKESGNWFESGDPFAYVTADQILKQVFLHIHGVTEEDVKNYRERPLVEGFVGDILIQTPHMQLGKGRLCEQFLAGYTKGQKAFKGLTENPLLKAWEFTLASLSESKADFAKWNLYASLGVQPEEPFGIGESIHRHLHEQVDRLNEEIEVSQSRYDHLYAQAKYLEGRMRRASTPNEAEWLRADYRIRGQEIERALTERDEAHERGHRLVNLFPFMIDFYGQKLRDYFQEVYDAEMHDISPNPYDDSPAGFRLLYKHGRTNTALWTMIQSANEYIQYLTAFFTTTEVELRGLPQMEGIEKDLSELVTIIITTIKRPEFLETSFYRLARAYKEPVVQHPLEHLDLVKRKPWAYISGGTMSTLVSCYYGNPSKPKEAKRWVESENELLAFLIDAIKELPLSVQQLYQKEPSRSMLAFSPTHAFLCKPGWELFRKAWESDLYTYTWIRDMWQNPQLRFLDEQLLDGRMAEYLIDELLPFFPAGYRPLIKTALKNFPFSLRPSEFREHVLKALSYEKWLDRHLELIGEEIDNTLYRSLPLFPEHLLQEKLYLLFKSIDESDEKVFKLIDELEVGRYKILSAKDLRDLAKELLVKALGKSRSPIPFHKKIVCAMQSQGLAYPRPILVADTNWVKNVFGFIVNPGTGRLELWRFDESGCEGRPMSAWLRYVNGSVRQEWGLYIAPGQYGQFSK